MAVNRITDSLQMQPDYLKLLAQFENEFSPISNNQLLTDNQLIEADNLLELLGEDIIWHETTPATNPLNKNLPSDLPKELKEALQQQGIKQLYSHQIKALKAVRQGRDIILSTTTSSGKSLSAYLPILEGVMQHEYTALAFYGLRALTSDQGQKVANLIKSIPQSTQPRLAMLTGDTSKEERERLLATNPQIIGATPELIHFALRGVHWSQPWQQFLSKLRYVLIDEAHTFNGVYGANMAALIRRLKLAVDSNGGNSNQLQFIFLSATIGNPVELARRLSSRNRQRNSTKADRLVWINSSGAATPSRQLIVTKPSHNANPDAARIILFLLQSGQSGICFCNGRQAIKNLWSTLRQEAIQQGYSSIEKQVAIFYSSLTSQRRTEIIQQLELGQIRCIISTSSLEAGIDLPQLDYVIIRGWPGSLQAFRQRLGRAGRVKAGLAVFIPIAQLPLDNYFATHPQLLLGAPSEQVSFSTNYPIDLAKHLMCAAVETGIPVTKLKYYFGKLALRIVTALMEQGVMHKSRGRLWAKGFPHKDVNFRGGINSSTVQLVDAESGEEVESLSAQIAIHEVFPGAIYRTQNSDGQLVNYRSETLELEMGKALLQLITETPLFTIAINRVDTCIHQELSTPKIVPLLVLTGESNGSTQVPLSIQLSLGWGEISQQVTGYQLLTRSYKLTCLQKKCVNYKEGLNERTHCPACGKRLRKAELTTVLNEVEFERPYAIKFSTPVVQISVSESVNRYWQEIVVRTRTQLLQAKQPIPTNYQQLWEYPAQFLVIHSFGHQILAALPLVVLSGMNDVSFRVEKRGIADYVGLFYDRVEGGSGSAEAIFKQLPKLAKVAGELARNCECESGCPKCLIQPGCPDGNKGLLKELGLLLCDALSLTEA